MPAATLADRLPRRRPTRAEILTQALLYVVEGHGDGVADRHLDALAVVVVGAWIRRRRQRIAEVDDLERSAVRVFRRQRRTA